MRVRTLQWLVLAMCLLVSGSLLAQVTATASIAGTITDSSNAVLSGAKVTVTNKATNYTRTVNTNSTGGYRLDLLPAGTYSVQVAKEGFSTQNSQASILVGTTSTLNFTLKPGSTAETVEVTGEVPILDQLKTDVSQNITPEQVQDLPIIGRDVGDLAYLAPGVKAADSYDPTKSRVAIISVNGQGGRNINVTVNGIDNKDNTVGGPVMQLPLEAVQEYQISTQRFSAANGRSEGAAINLITKSGTNNYHGSVFGFFRGKTLNADQTLSDGTKVNPPYARQFFGGSVGGPIVKDKLFGFFAIERQREHTSLAEDPGAYAELVLAQPIGAQPASVLPTPFYETRYNARMDWTINNKHTAYISYSSQGNNSLNDQSDATGDLTNGNFTKNHMQVANLTVSSVLSNTLVNQFTFGYQYWNNLIDSDISVPLVTFPDASFGTNTNVPQQSYQQKWQFKDDITKTMGKHTLKGGVDYIWNPKLGGFFEFSSTLEIDFAKNPSQILGNPGTYPQGFGTPGLITGMTIANGDPYFNLKNGTKQLGLYFQDDWKVSRRLTLNLGVRYDRDFNFLGNDAVTNSRTFQMLQNINDPVARAVTYKKPEDDKLDFSPRVGFAFDLTGSGNHVLRGGFGMYYGNSFLNIPLFMVQQANPTIFQTVFSLTGSDVVPGTGIPLNQWRYGIDPMPTVAPPSGELAEGSTGRVIDPNYRNPVTEEFNIGYAWQMNKTMVLEAEYVHVLGLHENKTVNLNPHLPELGGDRPLDAALAAAGIPNPIASLRNEMSINRSRYDGMNLSFRQRMTHHVSINANYTLSRAMSYDGGGGSFRNYPRDPRFPLAPYEFGPSANDERHHITFSGVFEMPWGMQFSPIIQYGSARPYNVTPSGDTLGFGSGSAQAVVVPKSNPRDFLGTTIVGDPATCYFAGDCTIAQYNPLRGDFFFQMDARLTKSIKLGESRALQLIAQAFNLTNRANYGNNFQGNISSNRFGKPIGFINPGNTTMARSLTGEFGVRFTF